MVWSDSNKFPPFDKGGIKGGFFWVGRHRGRPYSNKKGLTLFYIFKLAQFFGAQLLAQHLTYHGFG
jgi:hypothetical protein